MTAEKAINDWTRHADAAQFSLTDTGNARRLVHYTGDIIRYVPEWATWLVWDGVRWSPDGLGVVVEFMKVIATQNMIEEAQTVTNEDRRQHLLKWAMASESVSRIKAAIELAKTDVDVAVSAETLDTEKWLLTCLNGTLDLKTGELRPARQDDLITKLVPFEYDPAAKCPQFEKFLDWALCGRAGLVDFVQRALGYSMTGDVSERKMFFLHGQGQNGKSTLLKTFRRILGDYATKADAATFMLDPKNSGDAATPSLARLKGARMINSAEMEDGMAMAESLVKDWIGDDSVTARHLYERKVEFWPEFKFWISSNYLPTVSAVDQAVWDRLRLIPFDARISEEDKDLELYDKLLEEAPGILAWAVRGLIAWHARHLNVDVPVEVLAAGAQYREDMDFFKHFLEDGLPGAPWTPYSTLFSEVGTGCVWLIAENDDPIPFTFETGPSDTVNVWLVEILPVPGPTVTSVSPSAGYIGASVTVTGSNFTGATAVDFGSTSATFTVVSAEEITATAPAGTGTVDITVTSPNGTSPTSAADEFAYVWAGPFSVSVALSQAQAQIVLT